MLFGLEVFGALSLACASHRDPWPTSGLHPPIPTEASRCSVEVKQTSLELLAALVPPALDMWSYLTLEFSNFLISGGGCAWKCLSYEMLSKEDSCFSLAGLPSLSTSAPRPTPMPQRPSQGGQGANRPPDLLLTAQQARGMGWGLSFSWVNTVINGLKVIKTPRSLKPVFAAVVSCHVAKIKKPGDE